ncbi:hypothetical protein LTR22_028297 [Elasticomyces elasticus]|nr:hypothetical protein LTR22_028297 [Elasticomyces elasticus]
MRDRTRPDRGSTPSIEDGASKRRRLENAASANADPRKGTSRRKNACQSCRLRKMKCDALRPVCGICHATGSSCLYTDPFVEKITLESVTELLSGKLAKLQDGMDRLQDFHLREDTSSVSRNHGGVPEVPTNRETSQTAESSSESQHIPAQRTTADAVLRWEIFEEKYPPSALIASHFTGREDELNEAASNSQDTFTIRDGVQGPNEEDVPALVENFLRNVHTKNPVLDADQLYCLLQR